MSRLFKGRGPLLCTAGFLCITTVAAMGVFSRSHATNATLPVSARLVRAVEITISNTLDFGTLGFSPTQAGKVRLDAATSALVTDDGSGLYALGGKPQAGQIVISGTEVPIQLSLEKPRVQLSNGQDYVIVSDFSFLNGGAEDRITITPDAADRPITLSLGATLHTRVGQTGGHYVGINRIYAHYE